MKKVLFGIALACMVSFVPALQFVTADPSVSVDITDKDKDKEKKKKKCGEAQKEEASGEKKACGTEEKKGCCPSKAAEKKSCGGSKEVQ